MKPTIKSLEIQIDTLNRYIVTLERRLSEEKAKVEIYERTQRSTELLTEVCGRASEAMAHIVSDFKGLRFSNKI